MKSLTTLWNDFQEIVQENQNDCRPSREKEKIPSEWEAEIAEIDRFSPMSFSEFCISLLIPIYNLYAVWAFRNDREKARKNKKRKEVLQNKIREINYYNHSIDQEVKEWEKRQGERDSKLNRIVSEAVKLMASRDYFEQVFSSANAADVDNEIYQQCLFAELFHTKKRKRDFLFCDTYLLSAVDLTRDVTVTDNCISYIPTGDAWGMLEKAGESSRMAKLLYHASVWKMNEILPLYCMEHQLDASLVPSCSLVDYLAQHGITQLSSEEERVYRWISNEKYSRTLCTLGEIQQNGEDKILELFEKMKKRIVDPYYILTYCDLTKQCKLTDAYQEQWLKKNVEISATNRTDANFFVNILLALNDFMNMHGNKFLAVRSQVQGVIEGVKINVESAIRNAHSMIETQLNQMNATASFRSEFWSSHGYGIVLEAVRPYTAVLDQAGVHYNVQTNGISIDGKAEEIMYIHCLSNDVTDDCLHILEWIGNRSLNDRERKCLITVQGILALFKTRDKAIDDLIKTA